MKYTVPAKLPALRERLRGAEQHRRVPVVAAGVHAPRMTRLVGHAGRFVDVQRIEVGTQADRALARAMAQHADDAGLGEAGVHLEAQACQLVGDERGGGAFLERGFRVRVQVVAPVAHFRFEGLDLGNEVHRGTSWSGVPRDATAPSHVPGSISRRRYHGGGGKRA